MKKIRNGFTLVELLVVIAIICVLIALLLPTLKGARDAAKSAACLSNLKQCSMAVNTYASDNNMVIPVFRIVMGGSYQSWARMMIGGTAVCGPASTDYGATDQTAPAYGDRRIIVCPSCLFYQQNQQSTVTNCEYEACYAIYFGGSVSNYGNTFETIYAPNPAWPPGQNNDQLFVQKINALPWNPGTAVFLGDSYTGNWGSGPSFGVGQMCSTFSDTGDGAWSGRLQTIHNDKCNTAFYDGHAESNTSNQLYRRATPKDTYFADKNGKGYYWATAAQKVVDHP